MITEGLKIAGGEAGLPKFLLSPELSLVILRRSIGMDSEGTHMHYFFNSKLFCDRI